MGYVVKKGDWSFVVQSGQILADRPPAGQYEIQLPSREGYDYVVVVVKLKNLKGRHATCDAGPVTFMGISGAVMLHAGGSTVWAPSAGCAESSGSSTVTYDFEFEVSEALLANTEVIFDGFGDFPPVLIATITSTTS